MKDNKMPPEMPCPHTRKAVQEIDAAMFSGDVFFDSEAREHLEWYMERWKLGLRGIKKMVGELDE